MKIQILVDHLEHNGKRIEQGEIIEVSEPQANALIAIGVARKVDGEAKRGKKDE